MTAETLRRAAALMRERAADAFHDNSRDLWTAIPSLDPENEGWIVCEQRQPDVDWDTTVARLPYDYEGRVARHVAAWHPAVTLAVARVLEAEADDHDRRLKSVNRMIPTAEIDEVHIPPAALVLARLYLSDPCCDEGMTCLECDPDATFADIYGGDQ